MNGPLRATPLNVTLGTSARIDDVRIKDIKELSPPAHILREFTATDAAVETTWASRQCIHRILKRSDDRLLVVIGPCSIHDYDAAMEYAHRLRAERERLADHLEIVMRVYFEKPRITDSRVHRWLASGLPFPVGFKSGTDGNIRIAARLQAACKRCVQCGDRHQHLGQIALRRRRGQVEIAQHERRSADDCDLMPALRQHLRDAARRIAAQAFSWAGAPCKGHFASAMSSRRACRSRRSALRPSMRASIAPSLRLSISRSRGVGSSASRSAGRSA